MFFIFRDSLYKTYQNLLHFFIFRDSLYKTLKLTTMFFISGTVFSGLFCLCLGIPRFSQKDGPKPRIGAFLIDTIIGVGQFFTVLFCLVGWGWSIWWGVIMLKVASKYDC